MKKFKNIKKEFFDFLLLDKGYSERTISSYKRDLRKFEVYVAEYGISFKKITKENLFDYHLDLSRSIGARSFARMLSTLKTFYKFLYSEELVNDVVLNNIISYPTPKFKKSIPSFLNYDKIKYVLKNIDKQDESETIKCRNKALIMLFFTSGIRLEEMTNLLLKDINFDEKSMKIFGKGSKERIANFDNESLELIKIYLKKIGKYPLLNSHLNNNLFVDKDNKALKRDKIQYIVMKNLKSLSLSSIGPHTLRHSFATHLLNKGVGLSAIKSLLGHENLSSTQVYTHVSLEKLQETISKAHPRGNK